MIYLDSSALVKLIKNEEETPELVQFLATATPLTSSLIAKIEIMRAVKRSRNIDYLNAAMQLIEGLNFIELTPAIMSIAQHVGSAELRTLDTIHLASAVHMQSNINIFCCYDIQLRYKVCSYNWYIYGNYFWCSSHSHLP